MASYDSAIFAWDEGQRRLRAADAVDRRALERVTERIVSELRRRLGSTFTTEELAELYAAGTDWCLDIAFAAAPGNPHAWNAQIVTDAAFGRYVREAADFAGGRRLDARTG
jgi:hypothetical protein